MSEPLMPRHPAQRPASGGASASGVQIVDTPAGPVHHPSDLFALVLSVLATGGVMLLGMYAHGTTAGIAQDVQGLGALLRRALIFPVAALIGTVTMVVPVLLLAELAVRRHGRLICQAVAGFVLALVLRTAVLAAVRAFGSADLVRVLSVVRPGGWTWSVPASVAMLAGLLTTAGPRTSRATVSLSWKLLWVALGVALVTGQLSLPGAAVALLVGRVAGFCVRYASGVPSERAYGVALVHGIRRAGFEPVRLVRIEELNELEPAADGLVGPVPRRAGVDGVAAIARASDTRVYELTTVPGQRLTVVVFDGDRQVAGGLARLWKSWRVRGIEARSFASLRQAAERAALLAYAARAAGVRTPALLAVAEAQNSMVLVQENPWGAGPVRDLDPGRISDEVLRAIWAQLRLAHQAGIAHRSLTSDTVLVDLAAAEPVVWLTGWESGDVASSDLARRIDLTQMVALLALRVGPQRAVDSASAVLADTDLAGIGPLLQTVALPRQTREEMHEHRQVLADLRSAVVERLPEADVEPARLVRFGARTVLTVILPVVVVIVVVTSISVDQIASALAASDWRWSVVAFALDLLTFVGAGLTFTAFSPVRLSLRAATLVHAVGAFAGIAAPAGIGSAALNLRMLTKRGVSTSLAVATVALVQVSQFVVTIALLLLLTMTSSASAASLVTPSPTTVVVIAAIAAFLSVSLLVPGVRDWLASRAMPTVRQMWPRLIEIIGHPGKVAVAIGGNVLLTMGYILAFDASLAAFGQKLGLVQVALVYLAGNAAGAAIPTPGGIGTIEVAFIGGLTAAGLNPGVAASVTIVFRVVTFWLPIPIGWGAMRYLQRTGEL